MALGLGYLLTDRLLAFEWIGPVLRSMTIGTLVTIACLVLLFPAEDERLRRTFVRSVRVSP
jgi:hypothetical protein